jgi:hypothetical protein
MSLDLWDKKPLTFKAGDKLHMRLSNGTLGKTKIHIVGLVNDRGIDVVMYRWWVGHKKYWRYEAETAINMSFNIRFWNKADADEKKRITARQAKKLRVKDQST